MVPLPEGKLENLIPLLYERFEEQSEKYGLTHKDSLHRAIREGYKLGFIDCYVNDTDAPTHLVILTRSIDLWDHPSTVYVQAIYISRSCRGNSGSLAAMVNLVQEYAKLHGMKEVCASSLCDSEGVPFSRVWEKAGFTPSQINYRKIL